MEFTVKQIADLIGGTVEGDATVKVNALAKIQEATPNAISFLSNLKYENYIYSTSAGAVIVDHKFTPRERIASTLIRVDDSYTAFTTLLEEYHKISSFSKQGVEEPCFMGKNTTVGSNIYRGAFSYIGHNCTIGNNVKIYPNSYIGDNVTIGDNTIIYAGVRIYSETRIGNYCSLHAGATLGSDGFGFAPQKDGSYKAIPQIGNVVLEDHVVVGANTVIDCATMGSTIIRSGVKLDNLIQIAHNVEIGKNTVIAAQAGVSGSSKIGENCIIGGQVGMVGHITIANRTSIGAQSGLLKSVEEEGTSMIGSPPLPVKGYFKSYAIYRKLPELMKRIEELEEKLLHLQPLEQ